MDMEKFEQTTCDTILGGRIKILQPMEGYRVAIDPVFLAAAVPASPGETILDVGTGVGAAALCLATRVPGVYVIGLELQREMVRLAAQNIELNTLREWVEVLNGDLQQPPPRLAPSTFSHVMANPPYFNQDVGTASPFLAKQLSNALPQGMMDLKAWINFACLMVRPKGTVSFIYPADRLEDLLHLLHGKLGAISIFPLWPTPKRPAKRVIIRGIKSVQGPTRLDQGLVLHGTDGHYTEAAEAILRHGGALPF